MEPEFNMTHGTEQCWNWNPRHATKRLSSFSYQSIFCHRQPSKFSGRDTSHDPEVMGSNLDRCWTFFAFYVFLSECPKSGYSRRCISTCNVKRSTKKSYPAALPDTIQVHIGEESPLKPNVLLFQRLAFLNIARQIPAQTRWCSDICWLPSNFRIIPDLEKNIF